MLYIVSTPIGNMGDITPRAVEMLKNADYILAEDTRHTGALLKKLEIEKIPFLSYFEHNEEKRIPEVITHLEQGKNICLVSDGGTPLISDPGFRLIRECSRKGILYTAVPGACAVTNALVLSGFATDSYFFIGFLPQKTGKRKEKIETVKKADATAVFYESPYKTGKLLKLLRDEFPAQECCIIREMTKIHEEIIRGTTEELYVNCKDKKFKGEITVVLAKKGKKQAV